MIVKNNRGDYAVVVGVWGGATKPKPRTKSTYMHFPKILLRDRPFNIEGVGCMIWFLEKKEHLKNILKALYT